MGTPITLIIGLGNPGLAYEKTRHNTGAWLVQELAQSQNITLRHENKLLGFCGTVKLHNNDCRLLIPSTYMNDSGQAVQAIVNFYRIPPEAILIAHDELDLPPGIARLKQGGGHGGHNGLRDIQTHLGSADFQRLRLGIGHPEQRHLVKHYVLDKPGKAEQEHISTAITEALSVLPLLAIGEQLVAMNQLHAVKNN